MKTPDYIVIGAMKCGTTTLAAQLGAQSGLFMTTPKEPNYFSDDDVFARGPESMGSAAVEHAATFSWAHTVDGLIDSYGRAMTDHQARHQRQPPGPRSGRRFSRRRGVRA